MRQMQNTSGVERTTRVKTAHLLDTLRKNRAKHIKNYQLAVEGYIDEAREKLMVQFKKAEEEIQKAFKRAAAELENFDPAKASDTFIFCRGLGFDLVAPRNYEEAYDQAIEMLTWETRDEIELSAAEFRCFVMDKWDWLEQFERSTSHYAMAALEKKAR